MPIGHLYRPIGLAALLAACVLALRHDQPASAPVRRVAFVGALEQAKDPSFAKFKAALSSAWVGRRDPPALDYYAAGTSDDTARFGPALRAAAAAQPSVLVLPTGAAALAVQQMGVPSPVVFSTYEDPVRTGVVESLRRSRRPVTGVYLGDALDLKRLELLKVAFPRVRSVAILADSLWKTPQELSQLLADARRLLDLSLVVVIADTTVELDERMRSPEAAAPDGWYIPATYIAYVAEAEVIGHVKRLRKPAMHSTAEEVVQGALMAYSPDNSFAYDAMAQLTVRVALGEDAGTIPVQRPYRYTLSVRIEPDAPWARIEPSVVRRADRVHRP